MSALRRRYGRAGADPLRSAVRKIQKMIADVESGNTEGSRDDAKVFEAINKLEDRIYKNWREHGNDDRRETEYVIAKGLRRRMREAVDIGHEARQARRHGEIRAILEGEREKLANMSSSERALYNYQQELKLTRGGR